MNHHPEPGSASWAELESSLVAVELELAALSEALRTSDAQAVECHASQLQRALALAVQRFTRAAATGGVPRHLRARLARAGGELAAQRDSLARATAALDRAMDMLMPGPPPDRAQALGRDPDSAVYTPSPM
jgi:hypothetical protein